MLYALYYALQTCVCIQSVELAIAEMGAVLCYVTIINHDHYQSIMINNTNQ